MSAHLPEGYEISTDPDRLDTDLIHHWLSTDTYWALGRDRRKQELAIAGSLNFGLYESTSGRQAAYARVVTDHATFAWLCDVYVGREDRGKGLGGALVEAVADRLAACGLPRITLATNDAHGMYEKAGFRALAAPEQWMTLGLADPGPPAG
ncbi:GNAT family N-acetyltransferase [Streptomyces pinistramenti]|uniref:GNAT family N-acetyltransferase n=1 Tax=Streptomyces pinistramenti TaxID=2884812 RepID=UPI001D078AEF|nr:GNAT family N-acetyltransferase [Streptomyces pinistramenti]MCB5911118.1 GNAT family N-acetyltransferase [Streptomyces pinistramenti]